MTEIGHSLIAAAYIGLAVSSLVVAVAIGGKIKPWERVGVGLGGGLFFTGCALTHVGLISHLITGQVVDASDFHHQAAVLMQVVGAPVFLIAAWPYLRGGWG